MSLKINLKSILYFTLFIQMAFQSWYISLGGSYFRSAVILSLITILLYIGGRYKDFLSDLQKILSIKQTKLLTIWGLWICASGIITILMGLNTIPKFLLNIFLRLFPLIILPYYLGFVFAQKCKIKTIVKFYYLLILFILLFGVIDFVLSYFNNDLLLNTFVNNRSLRDSSECKALFLGLPRIQSLFDEPSYLARFICVNLLFIYEFKTLNIKLTPFKYFNILIKKFYIPLTWAILIGTMSPIYLIIAIIETGAYLLIKNCRNFAIFFRSILLIVFWGVCSLYILLNVDLTGTFLYRIQATLNGLSSFEKFVAAEPSLANRIITYINTFIVFLQHPVFGVGFGNAVIFVYKQIFSSPVPLTDGLIGELSNPNPTGMNFAIFWNVLCETGLIGCILFYYFFIQALYSLNKFSKKCLSPITKKYLNIFIYIIVIFSLLSFYDSSLTDCYIWAVLGFIGAFIYNRKRRSLYEENNNS